MTKVVLITLLAVAAEALKVTNVEEPVPASDPCECLQWYDVHNNRGVMCRPGSPVLGRWKGLCKHFEKKITDNFCINTVWNASSPSIFLGGYQYCYVSSECDQLGERGSLVDEDLSIKDCYDTNDTRQLRTMDPLEMQVIANTQNVTLVNLMKYGYQTIGEWNKSTDAMKAEARAFGIPKMFDADASMSIDTSLETYYVLWGDKTYEVKQQLTQAYVEEQLGRNLGVNLNEQYTVRCTSGC
jgi:hypothetical protein